MWCSLTFCLRFLFSTSLPVRTASDSALARETDVSFSCHFFKIPRKNNDVDVSRPDAGVNEQNPTAELPLALKRAGSIETFRSVEIGQPKIPQNRAQQHECASTV